MLPTLFFGFSDRMPRLTTWTALHKMMTEQGSRVYNNTLLSRQLRQQGQEEEARRLKQSCGAYTPSVMCRGGHDTSHIIGLTQCCISDTDHIPPERMEQTVKLASADPHTLLCGVTNSETGIRVIYRWETDKDEAFFTWNGREPHEAFLKRVLPYHNVGFKLGNMYYANLFGFPFDQQTSDATRLSFLCYDANAVLNLEAEAFRVPHLVEQLSTAPSRQVPLRMRPSPFLNRDSSVFDNVESYVSRTTIYAPGSYNRYVSRCLYMLAYLGVGEGEALEWVLRRFADYRERDLRSMVKSVYKRQ